MLFQLQQLARNNSAAAVQQLLPWVREVFPSLNVTELTINQNVVSLNSVNGTITAGNGELLFFKFHSEEGEEETMDEYYNCEVLKNAGLPVLMPLFKSTQLGSQFLIYPKISAPTLFEVTRKLDQNFLDKRTVDEGLEKRVLASESKLNTLMREITLKTLKKVSFNEQARSPIHQLFFRRLKNSRSAPRSDIYYSDAFLKLPNGEEISFEALAQLQWQINGRVYRQSLAEIISEAKRLLDPERLSEVPVITAHGDDHNGNKFFINNENGDDELILFDPAFASDLQPALLSYVKTTFHDSMAHPFWLYEPTSIENMLMIQCSMSANMIKVNFDWPMTPYRRKSFQQKVKELWLPLIQALQQRGCLDREWRDVLRKALFCCPFLVTNLLDLQKFPPSVSLLALAKCVQLGSDEENSSADPKQFFQQLIQEL